MEELALLQKLPWESVLVVLAYELHHARRAQERMADALEGLVSDRAKTAPKRPTLRELLAVGAAFLVTL